MVGNGNGDDKKGEGDSGGPSSRGGTQSGAKDKGTFGRFVERNRGKASPSTGVMTEKEREAFAASFVKTVAGFEDLAKADWGELLQEMLNVVLMAGGAERSYVGTREVAVEVGSKERDLKLSDITSVLSELGHTVRSFSRSRSKEVRRALNDPSMRAFLSDTYGSEVDPMEVRGDLLHREAAHKFDGARYLEVRKRKLAAKPASVAEPEDDERY